MLSHQQCALKNHSFEQLSALQLWPRKWQGKIIFSFGSHCTLNVKSNQWRDFCYMCDFCHFCRYFKLIVLKITTIADCYSNLCDRLVVFALQRIFDLIIIMRKLFYLGIPTSNLCFAKYFCCMIINFIFLWRPHVLYVWEFHLMVVHLSRGYVCWWWLQRDPQNCEFSRKAEAMANP